MTLNYDRNDIEKIGKQKFIADYFENMLMTIFGKDVAIMGGAPRDWDVGQPAKDIDIFVHTTLTEKEIEKLILSLNLDFEEKKKDPNYAGNPLLISVWKVGYYGEEIQVIFTNKSTREVLRNFPVSISMITWSNPNGFVKTNAYKISREYETILKMNEDTYFSEYYIDKIKKKFIGYNYFTKFEDFLLMFNDDYLGQLDF